MNRLRRFVSAVSFLSVLLTAAAVYWACSTDSPRSDFLASDSVVVGALPQSASIAPADPLGAGFASRSERTTEVRSLLEQSVSLFAWCDAPIAAGWNRTPFLESPTAEVASHSLQTLKVRWQL